MPVNKRIVGLDYLRVSLAILIFLFHSHIHLKCDYGILNGFIDMGAIAMTGFFLLSGYALNITNKELEECKDIYKFYVKRLIHILPLYYVWGGLNVLIHIILEGKTAAVEELVLLPVEVFGIQSVFSTLFSFSHNSGSWFISCILMCYFVYPLILKLTKSLSDNARMNIIITLVIILLWSPIVRRYFHIQNIYSNPYFRILIFTIGVLISQMNVDQTDNKLILIFRKPIICILTILCLILGTSIAYYIGIPHDNMLYNWIALPSFMSLLVSLGHINFKESKALQYLSNLSFSIFLSQLSFVWAFVESLLSHIDLDYNFAKIIVSAIVCFCISNFFYFCIESPSTKYLKDKFLYKR